MEEQNGKLIRMATMSLGENKGKKRVYLQGKWLARAGFATGEKINITFGEGAVTVHLDPDGTRKVSGKANGDSVIDITNDELEQALARYPKLQVECREKTITITPSYTAKLVAKRELAPTEASVFSGGGFLSEAAKQAGFEPIMAVEIDQDYADIYAANHPTATVFNSCVAEVAIERMKQVGPVGLFTAGICCEPFTNIRRLDRGGQNKRDKDLPPEAHELGDMTHWALRAIEACNPHTVVLEEAREYLGSASSYVIMHVLKRLGYNVDGRVIDPLEYGELTGRKRTVIVATTGREIVWPQPCPSNRRIGEILEDVPESEWFCRETKSWLYDHWDKQTGKGNGFAAAQITAESTHVGTIKKRYFAQQGDNPVVAHPTDRSRHRWFTLTEVKRLHGIPDNYILPPAKTVAGEVVGQGVIVSLFRRIIESVAGRGAGAIFPSLKAA
jgi:DNA (cytosine-5)-methyltransferase 1